MTQPMRFRKKPVEVEAMQWNGTAKGASPIIDWILAAEPEGCARYHDNPHIPSLSVIQIDTLEGTMSADPYDWIIRGVKGEFYPCKPDIFAASYEPVASDMEPDAALIEPVKALLSPLSPNWPLASTAPRDEAVVDASIAAARGSTEGPQPPKEEK